MLYLTQLVYLHPGQEAAFEEFESQVIPLMSKYGGELVGRMKPGVGTWVDGIMAAPDEVHVVRFPDEAAFQAFAADPLRQELLPLKEQAIREVILIRGGRA